MQIEGQWTFADLNGNGWVHKSYRTKEEAIREAKRMYKNGNHIVVGQLIDFLGTLYIENQEYVKVGECE